MAAARIPSMRMLPIAREYLFIIAYARNGDLPSTKPTIPPARSMRPLKKLTSRSRISEKNFNTKEVVFWTSSPAVVKNDQTSSRSEVKTSESDLTIELMLTVFVASSDDSFKIEVVQQVRSKVRMSCAVQVRVLALLLFANSEGKYKLM